VYKRLPNIPRLWKRSAPTSAAPAPAPASVSGIAPPAPPAPPAPASEPALFLYNNAFNAKTFAIQAKNVAIQAKNVAEKANTRYSAKDNEKEQAKTNLIEAIDKLNGEIKDPNHPAHTSLPDNKINAAENVIQEAKKEIDAAKTVIQEAIHIGSVINDRILRSSNYADNANDIRYAAEKYVNAVDKLVEANKSSKYNTIIPDAEKVVTKAQEVIKETKPYVQQNTIFKTNNEKYDVLHYKYMNLDLPDTNPDKIKAKTDRDTAAQEKQAAEINKKTAETNKKTAENEYNNAIRDYNTAKNKIDNPSRFSRLFRRRTGGSKKRLSKRQRVRKNITKKRK